MTGCTSANALAGEADLVLAIGTRLQDFATGSWTVFANEDMRLVGVNTARFDATKHLAQTVIGDARETIAELGALLEGWAAPREWADRCATEVAEYHAYIDRIADPDQGNTELPTYAQVVGAVSRLATDDTYVLTAAGGFPGELVLSLIHI